MSRYEKLFGVRRRGRGRPVGRTADEEVFRMADKEYQDLARLARQRTYAVVAEENRERMRQVFEDEYKWLVSQRRKEERASA